MGNSLTFDSDTARPFDPRPGGSQHAAYQDASGAISIVVRSRLSGGGFAVNAGAVDYARKREEQVFLRLINPVNRVDVTVPLSEIQFGEVRHGRYGDFYIIDKDNLRASDYPPPMDFDNDDHVPF